MKAGASFVTSFLAVSATAFSTGTGTGTASYGTNAPVPTGSSNSSISNSWSQGNGHRIQELEDEVQSLRQQLEAVGSTCTSQAAPGSQSGSGSNPISSSASDSGSGSGSGSGSSSGSSASNPAGSPASSAAASSGGASLSSVNQALGSSGLAGGQGSSTSPGTGPAPVSTSTSLPTTTPDFYGIEPPASYSETASTYTVIVTPGESSVEATSSSPAGASTVTSHLTVTSQSVVTVTETYVGTKSIPSPPSSYSDVSSTDSATKSPVPPTASASYGYGSNGTVSGYATGSASSIIASMLGSSSSAHLTGVVSLSSASSGKSSVVSANSTTAHATGSGGSSAAYSTGSVVSANSTTAFATGTAPSSSSILSTGSIASANSTTAFATGSAPVISASPIVSDNSTSSSLAGTATSSSTRLPTASAKPNVTDCSAFCSKLTTFNDWDVTPMTCTPLTAGTTVNTPSGQSSVGCAASFTPEVDLCQITLNVKTSGTANTYMEVWLPNGNSTNSTWNGRTMSTDNGGLNGCVHYVDMQYVSGLGFAAIGDNAGHNGSSFDGTWTMDNNEAIVDWAWRARHASVDVGKQVVHSFYNEKPSKSYYVGCSAGGAQGLQSAQKFPDDFDGIISGASANDFNHLQDWNSHFYQVTGAAGNDTFLTLAQWTLVQSYVLNQCDEALDGVNDGILEDPTLCKFDVTAIPVCNATTVDTSTCLTATQIQTVEDVFKPLYNANNDIIYPPLLYGAQVDAFRLGLLSGSIQGIARDFFRGGVYNDSSFDITKISQADYTRADQLDDLHGNPSAFNADLSGFSAAGKKLMMYHGMADPMTSGYNSQRYYQKVAKTMGLSNTEIDSFLRFFRISGMAHCGVGGISGAGAWMFGQSGAAASATNNIVVDLVDWVENGNAPETLLGTKFWYDTPSMGIEFERRHCRYPYRTTYNGGDATSPDSWGCTFIDDWQSCEGTTCSADGTFT